MRRILKALLPYEARRRFRSLGIYRFQQAHHLALTSKRIDLCAAQFARVLSLASHRPLAGLTCLEVGCGWVLSHALVCYLLGARRVIATDIAPHAWPAVLGHAVHKAVSAVPRDVLSPFEDHSHLRERFERLRSIRRFSLEALFELGIEYRSPIDFAVQKLDEPIDFIYSMSVLEHVPCDDVLPLLRNLVSMLKNGGTMIHCFHLEDHKDVARLPFDFLAIPAEQFSRDIQSERGNRLRRSSWERIFRSLAGVDTHFLYSWSRNDRPLPQTIVPSVEYTDEADLRISHLGTYSTKQGNETSGT